MRFLLRIVGLSAIAAFTLLRLWIGVLGLAQFIGVDWAVVVTVGLLLLGFILPLQIAVLFGALTAWHWPLALAVIVAAPRLILVLPGLISTFLASRRHPRARWSSVKPA
jgi:hypothetical protein